MSAEQDIWQHGKGNLPEEKLLAYLEGRLSPQEQRDVEALLADEGMESDALEGLKELPAEQTQQLASRINYKLQHDLRKKRHHKRNHFADNKWAWLAVLVVLLLSVLGYCVLKMVE